MFVVTHQARHALASNSSYRHDVEISSSAEFARRVRHENASGALRTLAAVLANAVYIGELRTKAHAFSRLRRHAYHETLQVCISAQTSVSMGASDGRAAARSCKRVPVGVSCRGLKFVCLITTAVCIPTTPTLYRRILACFKHACSRSKSWLSLAPRRWRRRCCVSTV